MLREGFGLWGKMFTKCGIGVLWGDLYSGDMGLEGKFVLGEGGNFFGCNL